MVERRRGFGLDYEEISRKIADAALGEIILIDIPKEVEFQTRDFHEILGLFSARTMRRLEDIRGMQGPDFILSSDSKGRLTVYKDTISNINAFRSYYQQLKILLQDQPHIYPKVINFLVQRIRPKEREEIFYLPFDLSSGELRIGKMSSSVARALVRLLEVPSTYQQLH